jgi:uncharacterized protein (DUF58 family)
MRSPEFRPAASLLLPGRTFFIAALLFLMLSFGAFFSQPLFLIWFLAGLCLIPCVLADALILVLLIDRPRVEREMSSSLSQGEPARITLYIRRNGRPLLPASIWLYDLYPDTMRSAASPEGGADDIFPAKLDLKPLKKPAALVFEYSLLPRERGPWFFAGTDMLLGSLLGFWRLRMTCKAVSRGRTYPDFKKLTSAAEIRGLLEKGEMREIRRRGQGMEFESLRDYQQGDSIRAIDWRASSRSRRVDGGPKLIVRDYQEEQDQQILFIIDSGYRLGGDQFDSALNAMLLLSYVALKHGDGVGAASFGASEHWIPPRKGTSAFTGLMNGLYDLHSAPVPSSPFSALENALERLRRRSFIILVSNFREEDGESLSWILPRVERRHLLLLVSFHEQEAEALAAPAGTETRSAAPGEILERAAAFSYLASRRRLYRQWEHGGILILETTPGHISPDLINRYLSVKKSGRL